MIKVLIYNHQNDLNIMKIIMFSVENSYLKNEENYRVDNYVENVIDKY